MVREVRTSDAATLTETLASGRPVIGVVPAGTAEDMRRFITWAHLERAAGRAVCYVVLPSRDLAPVGVILARRVERGFAMAEWSYCAIAEGHERTLLAGARAVLDLLFREFSVLRLETRATATSASDRQFLERIGAQAECRLHVADGVPDVEADRTLWALDRTHWLRAHPLSEGFWSPDPAPPSVELASAASVEAGRTLPDAWYQRVADLGAYRVRVRELITADAPSLHEHLAATPVARFLPPPPNGVLGFERFIAWVHERRATGTTVCLGIAHGPDRPAVGLLQVHPLDHQGRTAEWGFALGEAFWGTGLFTDAASLMLDFVFDTLRVTRLEARVQPENTRAAGVLRKLGGVSEGRLYRVHPADGRGTVNEIWRLLDSDWYARPRPTTVPASALAR